MKTNKWMALASAVLFIAGFIACGGGGGKYADAKKVMEESLQTMQDFIGAVEKADSAPEVAAALNAFTKKMNELKPKVMELETKYPELKDETTAPEELKPLMKGMEEFGQRFMGVMMKIAQYESDPEVKKAMEGMDQIWQ